MRYSIFLTQKVSKINVNMWKQSLSVTLSHSRPFSVTLSHSLSLSVTLGHSQSLSVTLSHSLSLSVTLGHSQSLSATLCHSQSLSVTLSHCLYIKLRYLATVFTSENLNFFDMFEPWQTDGNWMDIEQHCQQYTQCLWYWVTNSKFIWLTQYIGQQMNIKRR
jgi:hypothetical protein